MNLMRCTICVSFDYLIHPVSCTDRNRPSIKEGMGLSLLRTQIAFLKRKQLQPGFLYLNMIENI